MVNRQLSAGEVGEVARTGHHHCNGALTGQNGNSGFALVYYRKVQHANLRMRVLRARAREWFQQLLTEYGCQLEVGCTVVGALSLL